MRWRRRDRIFAPDGRAWWARAYAFPPTPLVLDDTTLRVYVACCDEHTVGRVGYVDVRRDDPSRIVRVAERPVLDVGDPGTFDEHGVVPTHVVPVGDELFLFYTGYQRRTDVPYTQLCGLAVSRDGGESFARHREAPLLKPIEREATTRGSVHVVHDEDRFVMYYAGGTGFVAEGERRLPVYELRRLESLDPTVWEGEGEVCLALAGDDEHALARPWLLPPAGEGDLRMLYSFRARSHDYRIGVAVSADGRTWERTAEPAGIAPSGTGWDSEAVAYGATADEYLFYCGNGRGRTGFGYAELEDE